MTIVSLDWDVSTLTRFAACSVFRATLPLFIFVAQYSRVCRPTMFKRAGLKIELIDRALISCL